MYGLIDVCMDGYMSVYVIRVCVPRVYVFIYTLCAYMMFSVLCEDVCVVCSSFPGDGHQILVFTTEHQNSLHLFCSLSRYVACSLSFMVCVVYVVCVVVVVCTV